MNCAVCGKDNQPGTRFCVHCGASLAAPAPGARPAAAAAPPTMVNVAVQTAARPAASAAGEETVIRPAAPGAPAYDAQPSAGAGKIVLGLGIAALVIAAGFVGYKIFGGSSDVKDSFARFDGTPRVETPAPRPSASTPPTPAAEPVVAAPVAPPPEPSKADDKSAPANADAAKADTAKAEATKAGAAADEKPKAPATPKGDGKATGKGAAPANSAATTPAAPATPAPRPAPPPVAAPAPADAAPPQDRWAQMGEELQRCKSESLFNRIVCDQRVRLRFCDGYWGKVAQCPGNVVNPDKGQ